VKAHLPLRGLCCVVTSASQLTLPAGEENTKRPVFDVPFFALVPSCSFFLSFRCILLLLLVVVC
jgi:hypothetical protein